VKKAVRAAVALLVVVTAGCGSFNKPAAPADTGGDKGDGGQAQAQGSGIDPTQFVEAPAKLPICADAKVGWMVERTTRAGGTTLVESHAIVGDKGDSWLVESRTLAAEAMSASYPELEGLLLGLTVRKSDGTVTKAVLGKAGEPGKPVKIGAGAQGGEAPPEPVAERVAIGALGTHEAMKTTAKTATGEVTTWVGTAGDYKGLLLKSQGPNADYELTGAPTREAKDVGGVSVPTLSVTYSNGMKLWLTGHDVVACVTGAAGPDGKRIAPFRTEAAGSVTEVTAIRTDAAPQLVWQ
jgi:hypothetical protein